MRELDNPAIRVMKRIFCRTTEAGSRTIVDAALRGPETHGKYLRDSKVQPCSPLVESKEGEDIQRRFWDELAAKLERIQPGVLKALSA